MDTADRRGKGIESDTDCRFLDVCVTFACPGWILNDVKKDYAAVM